MIYWRKLRGSLKDGPAQDLPLALGTAMNIAVRIGSYGMAAIAGIVVARALGAHDRGVYSLITTIAFMYAAFSELGITHAGVYFVGQKRHSLQEVTSSTLGWWLTLGAVWVGVCLTLGITQPSFVPEKLEPAHFFVFAVGGLLIQFIVIIENLIVARGNVLWYNAIQFIEPFLRALLIITAVLVFGVSIVGVLWAWTLALVPAALLAAVVMARRVRLVPSLRPSLLKEQLSYGLRGSMGFILQTANYRLDVFIVAAIVGPAALGYYAVAFGMAELLWQIPFALGAMFFPKVSAMNADQNAEAAAVTCRRALVIVCAGVLALLVVGRFLIEFLYGQEFSPAVAPFYILAPSAIFYTVHRVLSSALAGRGMPEATLYGGLISVPVTLGLDFLLIPVIGIVGAAVASTTAYAVNALVILVIFLRVTKQPLLNVLVINRSDVTFSLQTVRSFLGRSEPVAAESGGG